MLAPLFALKPFTKLQHNLVHILVDILVDQRMMRFVLTSYSFKSLTKIILNIIVISNPIGAISAKYDSFHPSSMGYQVKTRGSFLGMALGQPTGWQWVTRKAF